MAEKLTKEALAAMLNGREYSQEITSEEEKLAAESGLIVAFGASDDLLEFRGALGGELGGYNKITCCVTGDGKIKRKKVDGGASVQATYCGEKLPNAWLVETDAQHANFDIMEEGELFCRGVVFEKPIAISPPDIIQELKAVAEKPLVHRIEESEGIIRLSFGGVEVCAHPDGTPEAVALLRFDAAQRAVLALAAALISVRT